MATPYETLCENYRDTRQVYFDDENACRDIANELWKSLANYLGLPPDKNGFPSEKLVLLHPYEKPAASDDMGRLTSAGALAIGKDFFWHFNLGLTIQEAENTFPKAQLIIQVTLKAYPKFVALKVDGLGNSFFKFSRKGKFVDRNRDFGLKITRTCNRIVELVNRNIKSNGFFEHGEDKFTIHESL